MTLPATMPALVLREAGFARAAVPPVPLELAEHLELRAMPLPVPGPGQVLIRVGLAPVNPSDLYFIQGGYGQPRQAGAPAGFEGMGVVVAGEGPQAQALTGRRVAFVAAAGAGSWASHALADAALCIPLRDDLADADGAALIVNPLTAVAMLEMVRAAGSGAVVLNAAASQLGRLMLGLARDMGIVPVAILRRGGAEAELRALGAAHVLASDAPDFAAALQAVLRAEKPRVLLDAVGDQIAADIFCAMPAGSRWVCYGKFGTEAPRLEQMGQLIFMGKRIEGFWLSRWLPGAAPETRARAVETVQARFADGRWQTRVAVRMGLEAAMTGMLPALAAGGGKVMLAP